MKTFQKKCKWGTFLLLRGDMISQFVDIYGEWCELEVALFRDLLDKGSNVVEVGSNIGMHSVPLSRFVPDGRVFCFEPQRVLFQVLCANSAINNRTNIHTYHAAVGGTGSVIEIETSDYEEPWNYGAFSVADGFSAEGNYAGGHDRESVQLVTLDSHPVVGSLDSLAMLKVDTEGMETAVLDGARGLINRYSPSIFVENNNREKGDALISYINDLGYTCYWYGVERAIPENYNKVPTKVPGGDLNMICFRGGLPGGLPDLVEAVSMDDIASGKVPWIKRDVPPPYEGD